MVGIVSKNLPNLVYANGLKAPPRTIPKNGNYQIRITHSENVKVLVQPSRLGKKSSRAPTFLIRKVSGKSGAFRLESGGRPF